jgi:predicted dehydrogenase
MPLRIGFAGANPERGWARDAHFPALKALPRLSVHAVSARTQEIADAAAAEFGASKAFGDSLAMARDPEVDVVAVTVKVPEHRAIVLAALEASKHVYCEWPLARDLTEAEQLADAAGKAGTHVCIGLQGADAIAVRHAAKLVREGVIGEPMALRVVSSTQGWGTVAPPFYAYLQDKRNGATLASIAGGHTLAMIEAIVGPYAELGARNSILVPQVQLAGSGERVQRTCADHMLIHGRHASGCISNVEITGGANVPLAFELRGSKGTLTIEGHHAGGYQCGDLTVHCSVETEPQPEPALAGLSAQAINVGQLWAHFENDIRSGARTVPDFAAAVKLHALLDAIDKASDEGRTIRIG